MSLSLRLIALFSSIASLTVACSAAPGADPGAAADPASANAIRVDAATISAQPAGTKYSVDMTRADAAYDFDYSAAAIDFSRVLLQFGGGHDVVMSDWLATTAQGGPDAVTTHPGHLLVRAAQSTESAPSLRAGIHPEVNCVEVCMDMCGASGECTRECIVSCTGGGGGHLPI